MATPNGGDTVLYYPDSRKVDINLRPLPLDMEPELLEQLAIGGTDALYNGGVPVLATVAEIDEAGLLTVMIPPLRDPGGNPWIRRGVAFGAKSEDGSHYALPV